MNRIANHAMTTATSAPEREEDEHDVYEQYVRLHAVPEIGRIRLSRLAPRDLQRLYARRLAAGSSPTTVAHLHAMLHRALGQAVRWGVTQRNVVALVDPPRGRRVEMRVLSAEEARKLLSAAAEDRLEALYVLALATGMRLGELLGLRWRDVDLRVGTLWVSGSMQRTSKGLRLTEPKTARSRRQIVLSATAVEALRRHADKQEQERVRLGPAWEDNGLVFPNRVGCPLEAQNVLQRSLRPLLQRAGLPPIRFHDLRHTAATLLLGRGIHPKIVADLLGHSTTAVTNDVYSHVTPTMHQAAVGALEDVLRPARRNFFGFRSTAL